MDDPIPVSDRVSGFSYAIRNIVGEAKKVEAAGRTVRYLNIGDPVAFGFQTPAHIQEALERAIADGHNGYGPSAGILAGREAVAEEQTQTRCGGFPDPLLLTPRRSRGIEPGPQRLRKS